jgi:hypothetical protein
MASATHDLELFVRDALLRGLKKEDIRKAMVDAGWTEDQVLSTLGAKNCHGIYPRRVSN